MSTRNGCPGDKCGPYAVLLGAMALTQDEGAPVNAILKCTACMPHSRQPLAFGYTRVAHPSPFSPLALTAVGLVGLHLGAGRSDGSGSIEPLAGVL